ncbi:MAG: biopolymer transporter ExbD [Planctomycetaceae bacterium]|nr:biopolymer transporter ExbD [Planctomycetaceae bacterium]
MRRALFDDDEADAGVLSRKREKGDDLHIDFTPMIDCVVLLLGYFMVTTNLDESNNVDVPSAKHGAAASTETSTTVTVRSDPAPDRLPAVYLGGGTARPGDLGDGDTGVKKYVEDRLRQGMKHVIVRADRDVPFGFIQDVTRVISSVEGATFSIAVQDQKE